MNNKGLFSSIFIEELKKNTEIDDAATGRMKTLSVSWDNYKREKPEYLWENFLKQAVSYLEFVPPISQSTFGAYGLYEDWNFTNCISILYLIPKDSDIDDKTVGNFHPAKLIAHLKKRNLNWGILTDGANWRLYSTKSSRPYEDYVEVCLSKILEESDENEYGLFERFFHKNSFTLISHNNADDTEKTKNINRCNLDHDRKESEKLLEERVKNPLLIQIDEVLQYICNGFIFDTPKTGEEYTDVEREEIFESAVKLIYRCLFLFYAEARRLLPSDADKIDDYKKYSIQTICDSARKFRWGERFDIDQYDLWKQLKGLINAVNDGDPEYGIMGYNGGLFDDEEELFLGKHQLRNDYFSRALYLLAFVEPGSNKRENEYRIPYGDLEVRHLGEIYENILEYTVKLADADLIRRNTKNGVGILLASQTTKKQGDRDIKKGEVYFGESAFERKQTGSYYTPEPLVRFLNEKTIVSPLIEKFELNYRSRFNEFLDKINNSNDIDIKRGAAQSAALMIEQFVLNEMVSFKICDPAMGSGHFLVDATNQMSDLIVSLLGEIPSTGQIPVSFNSDSNYWRRIVTQNCVYGVDLNPLAVNLAKLSLWLNCFAVEHKLTFLDHHIRCGNSLIGIKSLQELSIIPERKREKNKNKNDQGLLFDYNDLSSVLAEAGKRINSIAEVEEDDTETKKAEFNKVLGIISNIKPLADLYTTYLMNPKISKNDYKELFELIAAGGSVDSTLNTYLPKILEEVDEYKRRHRFFHWPLEFPDVFSQETAGGFSATVGNPPWDVLQPNSQEFYEIYYPNFRKYKKQEALKVIEKLQIKNPMITEKWKEYQNNFKEASVYFKEQVAYHCLQKGKIDLYKAFLERFFIILKKDGCMGILVPSGIYTDQSSQPLREMLFKHSKINFLYCFENRWPKVFTSVDGRFKFVLFGTKKSGKTESFRCAFIKHDPELLSEIDKNALEMSINQVNNFSPDELSIMEFDNQKDIDLMNIIYKNWTRLYEKNKDLKFYLLQEFNMTNDSHLFYITNNDNRYPLFEGGTFWQFDSSFSESRYFLEKKDAREHIRQKFRNNSVLTCDDYKLLFRGIASPTNQRTLISSIAPKGVVCNHNVMVVKTEDLSSNPYLDIAYIMGISNSFVLDWVIRNYGTNYIKFDTLLNLPIPRKFNFLSWIKNDIIARSSRLISFEKNFKELWKNIYSDNWQYPDFWYPDSAPIDNYGPIHEQEIRLRLREEAKNLTPEWGPHCGVHDRLPDRRDTGDRAQLRAEIDAYVAHLYGLNKDDFSYILDTFPVLKKKEIKAFGEFLSKRKCLEEYDRISLILKNNPE
jgi:hypothetical protein